MSKKIGYYSNYNSSPDKAFETLYEDIKADIEVDLIIDVSHSIVKVDERYYATAIVLYNEIKED